jgi:uncharacterized protein (TIGR02300 family)
LAKPEWGTKHNCENCGAKFYDFQRDPIICPKCETKFTVVSTTRQKRSRATARPGVVAAPTPKPVMEEEAVVAQVEGIEDDDVDDTDAADDVTLLEDEEDLDDGLVKIAADNDGDSKDS